MDIAGIHAKSGNDALKEMSSSVSGISNEEATERLHKYGPNRLVGKKKTAMIVIFFRQFLNPLVYILAAAASVKAFVKGPVDAAVILGVLLFMAVVGFVQEARAEKAMEALLKMSSPRTKVRRSGHTEIVGTEKIVPGDIVILESGDKVPSDCRLLEAVNLKVNESSLTGESLPSEKDAGVIGVEASLGARKNMVFSGTAVVYGRGVAVVTGTGMNTEIGKIARAVSEQKQSKTTLQKSIDKLGKDLLWIILAACALLVALGFWRKLDPVDIFMMAVAAAVAAIPEGLPAVVTVVLASGMQRMARHNAIVRKLVAVETLGSTTVICSDKTGTLTLNQMTVKRIFSGMKMFEVTGEGYEPKGGFLSAGKPVRPDETPDLAMTLRIGALCNDADLSEKDGSYAVAGDPTEGALLAASGKMVSTMAGMREKWPRVGEIPFDSQKQFMATLHENDGKNIIFVKGAAEKLVPMAERYLIDGREEALGEDAKRKLQEAASGMASQAMRVLVAAYSRPGDMAGSLSEKHFSGSLVIAGLFGMMDPPRQEAKKAVEICHAGGIKVVMATGDNPVTGKAIADSIGMGGALSVTGEELGRMTDDELAEKIEDVSVFARIEPLHKMRIVKAFQKRGHIVAMTGDGVNDAPALEAADIGISMGIMGTDVAKESSDMVLADDNFATIVTAVEEGRAIFNRLRNVILFLMVTCSGELLALILGVIFTGQAPLVPLQILWVNLVTGALVAIPLGLEPMSGDELKNPPRDPKVGLIYPGLLMRIFFLGGMLGVGAFLVFLWTLGRYELHEARTMAFCSIVLFEYLVAFNARSDSRTIFSMGFFKNKWLIGAILLGASMQAAVIYLPQAHQPFDTVPLRPFEWGIALIPGVAVFFLETLRKVLAPKLFNLGKWRSLR